MIHNVYKIFSTSIEVSDVVLKKAYLSARSMAHPDKGGTKEFFVKVNDAWELINTPSKRSRYDKQYRIEYGLNEQSSQSQSTVQEDVYADYFSGIEKQMSDLLKKYKNAEMDAREWDMRSNKNKSDSENNSNQKVEQSNIKYKFGANKYNKKMKF